MGGAHLKAPLFSVHHIALRTRSVEALSEFYERLFALRRVRTQPRSVWLSRSGPSSIETPVLMIERADRPKERPPSKSSYDFLAFLLPRDERAKFRRRLRRLQVVIEEETKHTLYFRDPDGRRIGVSDYPF